MFFESRFDHRKASYHLLIKQPDCFTPQNETTYTYLNFLLVVEYVHLVEWARRVGVRQRYLGIYIQILAKL